MNEIRELHDFLSGKDVSGVLEKYNSAIDKDEVEKFVLQRLETLGGKRK